jgi:hypothetical protein
MSIRRASVTSFCALFIKAYRRILAHHNMLQRAGWQAKRSCVWQLYDVQFAACACRFANWSLPRKRRVTLCRYLIQLKPSHQGVSGA